MGIPMPRIMPLSFLSRTRLLQTERSLTQSEHKFREGSDVTALETRLPTSTKGIMPPARSRTLQFRVNDLEQLYAGAETWLQLTPGVLECTGTRVHLPAARITELNFNCG